MTIQFASVLPSPSNVKSSGRKRQIIFASLSLHKNPSRRSTRQTTVTYNPITVLENHLHVCYAPLIPRYEWSSHSGGKIFLQRCNSTWQQLATVTLFRYWQHQGITRCVAGVLHGRRQNQQTVFGFLSEILIVTPLDLSSTKEFESTNQFCLFAQNVNIGNRCKQSTALLEGRALIRGLRLVQYTDCYEACTTSAT